MTTAPIASDARPPESMSKVLTIVASRPGCRQLTADTNASGSTRDAGAAR